jgi:hypothetical protein
MTCKNLMHLQAWMPQLWQSMQTAALRWRWQSLQPVIGHWYKTFALGHLQVERETLPGRGLVRVSVVPCQLNHN